MKFVTGTDKAVTRRRDVSWARCAADTAFTWRNFSIVRARIVLQAGRIEGERAAKF